MGQHQHLFANQLGGDKALGLVRDLVRRKVLRALGQRGHHLIQQQVEPVPLGGGDRDHLGKAVQSGIVLDDGQQIAFVEEIDLVEQQKGFELAAFDQVERELVAGAELLGRVGDEQQQIAAFDRVVDLLHHALVERVGGLVDAGRVDENDLPGGTAAGAFEVDDAADPIARGLRFVGDDSELFAHQRVQQG